MKKVEEWIADAEEKIAEGRKRQKLRAERIKKATVIMSCLVLLIGVAFAVPYAMKDDSGVIPPDVLTDVDSDTDISTESSQTVPNTTADATESTPAESTEQPNPWPYGTVSYKNEDGTYSWDDFKTMGGGGGGTPYLCPEGHDLTSKFHSVPATLVTSLPEYEADNDYYQKYWHANRYYGIYKKCDNNTIKAFIDEFNVSREHFDMYVNLVYYYGYNLDVLFGNNENVDEFYQYSVIFARRHEMTYNYYTTAAKIINKYNVHERKDEIGWLDDSEKPQCSFMQTKSSIPELAYLLKLPREELEEVIREINEEEGYTLTYDYDFSVIYDEDGAFREDLSVLDVNNSTPEEIWMKSVELGERFCRIYDWEDPESFNDTFYVDNKDDWYRYDGDEPIHYKCDGRCISLLGGHFFKYYYPDVTDEESIKIEYELKKYSKHTLKAIILKHDISKEEFYSLIQSLPENKFDANTWAEKVEYYDYDIIRYSTDEEIDAYYSSFEHRKEHFKKISWETLNYTVIGQYYCDAEGNPLRDYVFRKSLPEIVQIGNICREELEAIIEEARLREEASQIYYGGEFCSYDYNLDVIYNEDGSFRDLSGYDKNTLELMFCGLLEYAAE